MIRLTVVVISLIGISLVLVGQGSAIKQENIAGIWLFDEGEGDIAKDSSPNGYDGEIVGPEWSAKGVFGSCLEFMALPILTITLIVGTMIASTTWGLVSFLL